MADSPIRIVSQNIYNKDSNTPTDWLLANVGDLLTIETIFEVKNAIVNGTSEPFIINNKDGYIELGWLTDASYRFANFRVGDIIYYFNYVDGNPAGGGTGYFTIIEKRSDGEIRLSPAPSSPENTEDYQGAISNTTPITSIRYSSNFTENSSADTFESQIDKTDDLLGSEQTYSIAKKLADDTTVSFMEPNGSKTWQIHPNSYIIDGNQSPVTIEGVSIQTSPIYISTYKIVEKTIVTPWILYSQLDNQLSGIAHKDFEITKCWKFISRIEAAEVFTNPNFLVSEIFNKKLGNSGWFNENFNTGITKYSISAPQFKNAGNIIDSIQFDSTETEITFDIDNADGIFTNDPNVIRIGFMRVPSDPADYQNGEYASINFLFDGAKVILGDPPASGYNILDPTLSVIKSAFAVYQSPYKISLKLVVQMSENVQQRFLGSQTPRYLIFASLKNYALDRIDPLNDQVTLQVAFSEFTYVTADPDMIVVDKSVFLQHPDHDPETEGINTTTLYNPVDAYTFSRFVGFMSGATVVAYLEGSNPGEFLGSATWGIGSTIPTLVAALIDSINTGVPDGTFAPFTTVVNPGITAVSNINTSIIEFKAPLGSKDLYNGKKVILVNNPSNDPNYYEGGVFYGGTKGAIKMLDIFVEDEIVACSQFYIERDTRLSDEIIITSIDCKVIATEGDNEFDLEKFTIQTGSVPLTGDTQQIDNSIIRPFHVPVEEPRKTVVVKRRNDLDTGSRKYFSVQFPFMFRWEDWEKLLNVDPFFLDATKPNNNFNHQWIHYNTGFWKINYQLVINATKNGVRQQYKHNDVFVPHNYESNPYYIARDIDTFDPDTLQPLVFTGKEYIHSSKKTLVVATFEIGYNVVLDNATVLIGMEVFGKGGILGKRSYSSRWVRDSDTWFESLNNDGLIELTVTYPVTGTLIVAKCLINNELLPQDSKSFSLMARCYEYGTIPDTFLVDDTDDENPLTDNANNDLITD